jgi:KAP-like P-loop domain-containing protein
VRLYAKLIKAVGRPVAIFIDDLDRCDSAYVVELIEGIQTLLRTEAVTYVVAADRKWICSAFEKKYGDFSGHIGEPARPLGYLFLDKLFQISAALPALSSDARTGYWKSLLDGTPAAPAGALSDKDAAAQVKGKTSIEALQAVIDDAPEAHQPALRAAAAVEITRPDSAQAVEHRLQRFAGLLEPNPRAMKRLVNAVGMAQARCFLEARSVSLDALARWTLIELRWPLLADYLADNVDAVDLVRATDDVRKAAILPAIAASLVADRQVSAIVAPEGGPGLDSTVLTAMLR